LSKESTKETREHHKKEKAIAYLEYAGAAALIIDPLVIVDEPIAIGLTADASRRLYNARKSQKSKSKQRKSKKRSSSKKRKG
jgi:hypothetical protein